MKKISYKYKKWHLLRDKNQSRRKFRKSGEKSAGVKNINSDSGTKNTISINPPVEFSLENNYDNVAKFIEELKNLALLHEGAPASSGPIGRQSGSRMRRFTDFRKIETIGTAAALLLAAEYDRLARLAEGKVKFLHVDEWNPKVKSTLGELGLFELFGENWETETSSSEEVIIKFISDEKAEGGLATTLRQKLDAALTELHGQQLNQKERLALRDSLVEAMTNVVHHAYPEEGYEFRHQPVRGAWWMTGAVSRSENLITVVFYDQGISIPGHFRMSPARSRMEKYLEKFYDLTSNLLGTSNDGKIIEAAVEVGATSTNEPGRGQGLSDIKSAVDRFAHGRLRILSRRGEYIYKTDEGTTVHEHKHSIGGTLIEWKLCP